MNEFPLPPAAPQPEHFAAAPEAVGIAARITEKVNTLTALPYDLLARWKTYTPELAEKLTDKNTLLGKLVSPIAEKASEWIEQIGPEHVGTIFKVGSAAVKAVLSAKGIIAATPSSIDTNEWMSQAVASATSVLDLNKTPKAPAEPVSVSFNMAAEPESNKNNLNKDYTVELGKWNEKTGEGSIWYALNNKDKGIAATLGYDQLTEKQKWQLADYVLKENDLSWKQATKISEFTMPSPTEIETKLKEIGATYNAEADKRETIGGSQTGENTSSNQPPKDTNGQSTQRGGEQGQSKTTPSPPSPSPTSSPQPGPQAAPLPLNPNPSSIVPPESTLGPSSPIEKIEEEAERMLVKDPNLVHRSLAIAAAGGLLLAGAGVGIHRKNRKKADEHFAEMEAKGWELHRHKGDLIWINPTENEALIKRLKKRADLLIRISELDEGDRGRLPDDWTELPNDELSALLERLEGGSRYLSRL